MFAAMAGGCGSKEPSQSEPQSEQSQVSAQESEKLPTTPEEWHDAMISKSLVSYGNTSKMQEKIKKAQSGEKVTIAYLGGSITEGISAGPSDCYAMLSYEHFAEKYGTSGNVDYVNAGLSGTPSKLGILRLQRDVLQYEPDICFIEFAVNDGTDAQYQNAYESIIRDLCKNDVAVVLLFSVTAEDYSAQDYMKTLGEYYDLPMISYCDALRYMFENGQMKWEDFSDDQSHPNTEGHQLVAEMVDNYFDTVTDITAEEYAFPEEPYTSAMEQGARLLENDTLVPDSMGSWTEGTTISRFNNGWSYVAGEGNEPFRVTLSGKFVYIIYKEVSQGNFGPVDIKVTSGGETVKELTLDPTDPSGWGNPQICNLVMDVSEKEYEIEIKMADGAEENAMEILAFAVV